MIRVVNKKTHKPTPDDFYIGRGSVMGNPYHHKESNHPQALYKVDTVEEAIDGYDKYLISKILSGDIEIINHIKNLVDRHLTGKDMNLVCFCKPNKCHGDVIANLIDGISWYINFEKLKLGKLSDDEGEVAKVAFIIWNRMLEDVSP